MQISVKEKIAYGLGDTASNIVFQTVMLFLAFFYTDIFGLSPAVVGTMFLLVRIIDAVTDPIMGAIADRTRTKYGKFRPYLIWMAIPFAGFSVLAFTTPDLSADGKLVYAFVTYALLMIAYTAINIPYCALGGVMTDDPTQRVSIQSYRFVLAMLGGLLVTTLTLPMVDWLGEGDKAKGYQLTIAVMSLFGMLMFLLCFLGTKERVSPPPSQISALKPELKSLWKNDQWRVLCAVVFFLLMLLVMRGTLSIYYVTYYLQREDLTTAFVTTGMLGNIVGCASAQWVASRFHRVKAYITLQWIGAFIAAGSFFISPSQVELAFIAYFLWSVALQTATPLLWAKMADTVDYGQSKTGIRITGLVYSANLFFLKLGMAFGGAMAGWLLAFYGYQAGQVQDAESQFGILFSFTVIPAVASLVVAYLMKFYRLDDAAMKKIQQTLAAEIEQKPEPVKG
ncbi:MAG: glycoside-pentoside-hexuronide (GPH):cation symporter [Gammaproteobacteria bacterium]|nr:glycoside-pentoside-hexuronide (GPH):cation symporter [Gammaproteobacteria bacterium]